MKLCVSCVSNWPSHSIAVQSCTLSTSCSYRWPAVWLCFLSQGQLVPSICSQNFTVTTSHVFTLLPTASTANPNSLTDTSPLRTPFSPGKLEAFVLLLLPGPCHSYTLSLRPNNMPVFVNTKPMYGTLDRTWKLWFTTRVHWGTHYRLWSRLVWINSYTGEVLYTARAAVDFFPPSCRW